MVITKLSFGTII